MTTAGAAPGRLRGQDLLRAVAEGTAGVVGEAFLRSLVRHVAEAFDARMAMVAESTDARGSHVRVLACWHAGAFIEEPIEYDTGGTPCALAVERPVVMFPEALTARFPEDRDLVDLGVESYLAVCLRASSGEHLGHLAVLDARPMDAGEEDVAALRIFAARAAAELERRRQEVALAASRTRIVEAGDVERRRIGRDLHDGAQQRLLAVTNLLRVAERLVETPRAAAAAPLLAQAGEELRHAHAELRALARGLHPVALAERGLSSALESLASASPVPVGLDVRGEAVPEGVAATVYFVVAESLANAARYAGCEQVSVRVASGDGRVRVEVDDDGCGGADPGAGTGLRGLADRVEAMGGRFSVESPDRGGTRVRAEVPVGAAG